MRSEVFLWLTLLLSGFLVGCGRSPARRLVLTGSSTVAPLAAELGKRFESRHPDVRVEVQTGGSSRGIADTRSGAASIGMASRALRPDESDLMSHTIALDGICVIVHGSNTVPSLSDAQVAAIYRGQVDNWLQVGGPDREIVIVNKAEGRATLDRFLKHFGLENREVEADVVIGDNEQGIKTVSGNPSAIGYVSIGTAAFNVRDGVSIRLLPAAGVAATLATVRAGRYPIRRPLNLLTRDLPAGLVKEFIDFARSPEVHDLIDAQYLVPRIP